MNIYELAKPFGIVVYVLLVLTIVSGLFRWKLKYHKILAFSTVIVATIHALVVILAG